MPIAVIREIQPGEDAVCEKILRSLPEWFGIEESLVQYVCDLPTLETYVAEGAGRLVGFIAVRSPNRFSAEVHVIAVRPDFHGHRLGRALLDHVEGRLRARSIEFLQSTWAVVLGSLRSRLRISWTGLVV